MWAASLLVAAYYSAPALVRLDQPHVVAWVLVPGAISLGALVYRHRAPRTASAVTLAALALSPAALGGVVGVLASRARHLPARACLPELALWAVAAVAIKAAHLAAPFLGGGWSPVAVVELTISSGLIGIALLIGLLVRATERSAQSARRAQQAHAAEIRLEERARIAREMHDVVAHRISLVAMTAGALAYRSDLPGEAREAVGIIQSNARGALDELRAVLSDLRDTSVLSGAAAEAPQPTLEQLAVLLADARDAGDVKADIEVDTASVPPAASRQMYRIIQEGLTNARKHAPGQPVYLRLARAVGEITLQIRNPVIEEAEHVGGYGLIGVQERVHMLGGSAGVDVVEGRFVLSVRIPEKVAA